MPRSPYVLPRNMFVLLLLCVAVSTLFGCMSIPASIVDKEQWLSATRESIDPSMYEAKQRGTFLPFIHADHDQIIHLMLIDLADDPVYRTWEVQVLEHEGSRYMTAIAERIDGTIDYYHEPHYPMSESRRNSIVALLGNPNIMAREFDASLKVLPEGLDMELDLADRDGRSIRIMVKEHAGNRKHSAILAPVSNHAMNPSSFPLVYLDEFSMVLKHNTTIELSIDGQTRKASTFPLLLDGRRVYLSRYSSRVVIADLLPEHIELIPIIRLDPEETRFTIGGTTYRVAWNDGYPEIDSADTKVMDNTITWDFSPAFPDVTSLSEGARVMGRFTLSVNDHEAVIAGTYSVAKEMGKIALHLEPQRSWQPPGMGKRWVSTFRYVAYLNRNDGEFSIESDWYRSFR